MAGSSRFVRQRDTARGYLDTETGKIISRRQRDKLMDAMGGRSKRDLAGVTASRIGLERQKSAAQDYARKHGITVAQARKSAGLRDALKKLKKTNPKDWKEVRDILKDLGRRDEIPDYVKPGESKKWQESGIAETAPKGTWYKTWLRYKKNGYAYD